MLSFNILSVSLLIGITTFWCVFVYINWKCKKQEKNESDEAASDLVLRLRTRASIRRQITTRKSVQENKPDRIADLLEEAANEIKRLRKNEK